MEKSVEPTRKLNSMNNLQRLTTNNKVEVAVKNADDAFTDLLGQNEVAQ
jgi:hypothetical protein